MIFEKQIKGQTNVTHILILVYVISNFIFLVKYKKRVLCFIFVFVLNPVKYMIIISSKINSLHN